MFHLDFILKTGHNSSLHM